MLVIIIQHVYTYMSRPRPTQKEAIHLISVLQRFSNDQQRTEATFRRSVAIEELIGAGYLTAKEVEPIQGADVVFSSPGLDYNPKRIIISVNLRSGGKVWLLADGSIRRISPP
jgi:hypothetical protein